MYMYNLFGLIGFGSCQLVNALVHPNYSWTTPTSVTFKCGCKPLASRMNPQTTCHGQDMVQLCLEFGAPKSSMSKGFSNQQVDLTN